MVSPLERGRPMNRLTRTLVTAASFALVAIAARTDAVSAQWYCYFCSWNCYIGMMGCEYECGPAEDFSKCYNDTIEWCDPGEIIVECKEPDPN